MADHISFFWGKAQPGKLDALVAHMNKWQREQKPAAKGWVRSIVVRGNNNADEFCGAVRWDNTANYFKNADRPEQSAWYQELTALVDGEIGWFDGTLAGEWTA